MELHRCHCANNVSTHCLLSSLHYQSFTFHKHCTTFLEYCLCDSWSPGNGIVLLYAVTTDPSVSDLAFLSKVLEKVVPTQISAYLCENYFHEANQSTYRKLHSTESAHDRFEVGVEFGWKLIWIL